MNAITSLSSENSSPFIPHSFPLKLVHSEAIIRRRAAQGIARRITGSGQRFIGTAGNDVLDASRSRGRNTLIGLGGNDRLLAGVSDRLLGGSGNDILDASRGRGRNALFGDAGNDTLLARSGDALNGGIGNDILWGGNGSNQLIGGQGADQFWIAKRLLPARPNIIRDFQQGLDVIGFNGVIGVDSLDDIAIDQQGRHTTIQVQNRTVATLLNVSANRLSFADFKGLLPAQEYTLSISGIDLSEGDGGTTRAVLNVSLSRASDRTVTVEYRTVAGTATPNQDYVPQAGTLLFTPGEVSKFVEIEIINDTIDENNETYSMVLSNAQNALLGVNQASIGIFDNDVTRQSAIQSQNDGSGTSDFDFGYRFDVYNATPDGRYRADEDGNLTNTSGRFSNAIENFVGVQSGDNQIFQNYKGLAIGNYYQSFPENIVPNLFINTPLTLNLEAQYLPRGSVIVLPDGTSAGVAEKNRVEYRLTNAELRNRAGIEEWTLILDDTLLREQQIDPTQAVNSIDYILAYGLLNQANSVRISAKALNGVGLQSRTRPLEFVQANYTSPPPRSLILQNPTDPRPLAIPISPNNDTIQNAANTGLLSPLVNSIQIFARIGDNTNIAPGLDVDLFKIQLNQGNSIEIDIDDPLNLTARFDNYLRVFDAWGQQVALNDNGVALGERSSTDAYLEFTANVAGVYYIGVSGKGNQSYNPVTGQNMQPGVFGDYALEIRRKS